MAAVVRESTKFSYQKVSQDWGGEGEGGGERTERNGKSGEQREKGARPLISSTGRALKPIAPVPFSAIEPCHEYTRSARSNFTTLNLRSKKNERCGKSKRGERSRRNSRVI
jgi:hypothetical protein